MIMYIKEFEFILIFMIWENDYFFFMVVDIIVKKKFVMRVLIFLIKEVVKIRLLNCLFLLEIKYLKLLWGYGLIFIVCLFVVLSFLFFFWYIY